MRVKVPRMSVMKWTPMIWLVSISLKPVYSQFSSSDSPFLSDPLTKDCIILCSSSPVVYGLELVRCFKSGCCSSPQDPGQAKQEQQDGGDKQEKGERKEEEEGVEMAEDFEGVLEDLEEDKDQDRSDESGGMT